MRKPSQHLLGILTAALAAAGLSLTPAPAQATSAGLVINEIYGGGGATSGSPYSKADFVELYNPTSSTVSTAGLSLQYRSSTFSTGTPTALALPSADVPAHTHYLVQVSAGSYGPALPVTPDFTATSTTLNMAAGSGQVILVQGTAPVTATGTSMQSAPNVVDFVGYGTATSSETAPTGTALTSATSVQRKTGADSDNNATDFAAPATPTPTAAPAAALSATDPGDVTTDVDAAMAPIQLTASGGTAPYSWATTTLPAGLALNGNRIEGTPTAVGTTTVTATVTDGAGATASTQFDVTVQASVPVTSIAEVQGTGADSPMVGQTRAVQGVVTALYRTGGFNGMYVQTAGTGGTTDATEGASDAIFVYGGAGAVNIPTGVQIGDSVRVTGAVSEFSGTTEITPAAGGVVELSSPLAPVTPRQIGYPATAAEREAQEGMLLAPTGDFTVTDAYSTNQYAEIGLAAGTSPLRQPTEFADATDAAAVQAIRDDNAARSVVLDDAATTNFLQNQTTKAIPVPWLTGSDGNAIAAPPRVGAAVTFHQPVILEYRNNLWKFQPRSQVTTNGASVATFEDTRTSDLAPQEVGGDIRIATFNVLNYFDTTGEAYVAAGPQQNPPLDTRCSYYTDRQSNRISNNTCGVVTDGVNAGNGPRGAATTASLQRQEAKLVHTVNTLGADIIGLEEMENSIKLPGETNRDEAVAHLVALLNAQAGAGTWAYVRSPGEAVTASAIAEQDVIRPAFIYKTETVVPVGKSDILFGTTEFANAREPLAQAFKAVGAPDSDAFAVVVNHFKSKGDNSAPGAPPATGDNAADGEVGAFNGDRKRQAARLLQFADDFAASRDVEAVFLAGDFNSYSGEEPVQVIENGGYHQVESDTPGEESYSYDGLSGSLDHVFANAAAMSMVTGADIWEINANEAASYMYSRYNYNVTSFWQPNLPFGTSDHNPEVIGVDLPDFTPTSYRDIQVVGTNDFHGRLLPDAGNAAGAAPFATAINELRAENPDTVFVAAGDLIGASTFESFIQDDEPTIDALNAMGLEVSAVGNHEFDRGYEDLVGRVQDRADWTYLAANVDEPAGRDELAETWTKDIGGTTVGFVGAVTEDLPGLVNPAGMDGVTVTDIVDATNSAAAQLKSDGADIVVLLVHEGATTTDCTSPTFTDPSTVFGEIAQETSPDVDAIISGHTHLAYNCRFPVAAWQSEGRAVTRRPVVSAGQYGTNLNKLVFHLDEQTDQLVGVSQDIIATAGVGYAPDPTVQAIVDDAVAFANTAGAQVLGKVGGPFKRAYRADGSTENRGGESTLGNLVAEAQRWATSRDGVSVHADIAFMNPGGLRADMVGTANGSGNDVTYRQAADVQPFANTLVNMNLTGAQIETVLEEQWQRNAQGGVPSRPFLRLGVSKGFTYTYEEVPVTVSAPNSAPVETFEGEVTGMWLDGQPIDPAATYSVTVNSFLGSGGDNFWELAKGRDKVDTGQIDLQAMVDYLAAKAPADAPLAVDYAQRAVEVTFPDAAPSTYQPGDQLTFDVASWAMTAPGDLQDAELTVWVGSRLVGTFPVVNGGNATPYDNAGAASIDLTLPADVSRGPITLVGATTGSTVRVPATVALPLVVNATPPTVSGTAAVGSTLTADPGTWTPTPGAVAYQWLVDGTEVAGATDDTYLVGPDDIGAVIAVRVTASASGHEDGVATSEPTAAVVKGTFQVTSASAVSGTPKVGNTLTGTPAVFSPDPGSVSYQWLADGTPVAGATGTTFEPGVDEVGKVITFRTTATGAGYEVAVSVSPATAAVAKGTFDVTSRSTVSGTPKIGKVLTGGPATFSPTPAAVTYQWLADGVPIAGETGTSLKLGKAEVGKRITFRTTATRTGYADGISLSEPTVPVAKGPGK
ncbi:MAG TPA: ExeM/NucH family extracellular endonuclease [Nocardioides sp.]|nr:ExeM/NucH family extracellular endonuclease [Nocardioides sp.]